MSFARSSLMLAAAAAPASALLAHDPSDGPRWLAGDHHIHSRYGVGWNKTDPPTPILGADASCPILMNAIMARRHALSWMVATDHGGMLKVPRGSDVRVTIRMRSPDMANANGDRPQVARVDLIRGDINGRAKDRTVDRNRPTTERLP